MGQLTNLYVSQSYQGLLKMTDSTNGLTNTLQTVQTGDGDNSPLQISTTQVNISGSFTVNGNPVTAINTGSFATTGSNTFTGNQLITGSEGYIALDGTTNGTLDNAFLSIHANNDGPWIGRYFNDTFSTGSSILSFWGDNDGTFHFHNESTASIKFGVNNYGDNFILNDTNVTSNRDLILSGSLYQTGTFYADQIDVSQGGIVQDTGSYVATFLNSGVMTYATYPEIVQALGQYSSSGTSGTSGTSGSDGSSGTSGTSGSSGLSGSSGTAGTSGSSGVSGSNGTSGTSGSSGVNGSSGSSGTAGTSGSSGVNGSNGSSGTAGSSGSSGNGTSGTSGTSGVSNSFFNYQSRTNTQTGDPNTGNIIWDNVSQTGSTSISVSDRDGNNDNVDIFLSNLGSGSVISIQDKTNHSNYQTYRLGTPVDNTTYWTWPVTLVSATHIFGNTNQVLFIITTTPSGTSGTSGTSGSAGSSGSAGTSGTSGSAGTSGSSGSTGTSGTAGTSGSSGSAGTSGSSGSAGSSGTSATFDSGSYATTGSNTFTGAQTLTNTQYPLLINNPVNGSGQLKFGFNTGTTWSQQEVQFLGDKNYFQTNGDLTFEGTLAGATGSIIFTSGKDITLQAPGTISANNQITINSYKGFIVNDNTFTAYAGVDFYTGGTGTQAQFTSTADKTYIQSKNDLYINSNNGGATTGSIYATSNKDLLLKAISGTTTVTSSIVSVISPSVAINSPSVRITGSLISSGSLTEIGNVTVQNPNMTNTFANVSSSYGGNVLFGWDGILAAQVLSTGSYVISGSNNILAVSRPTPAVGLYNYVSGSSNIMLGGSIAMTTASLLRPVTNNNLINFGQSTLYFQSSSVAGGQPSIQNNIINQTFLADMGVSGSLTATGNIINGAMSIYQTGSAIANLRSTFNANNINSTFFLQNYASSSFTANNNNTVGGGHYIDNYWVNGFGTAGVTTSRNLFQGQANGISISGSPSSNTSRAISDNFLGGNTAIIAANASGSNAGNSYATIIYGYNLTANATATGISGGSAFLGRFNDTGSFANTSDIVFAVGTGTAAGTRRNGLTIDTGSNVLVSGSFNVSGSATFSGTAFRVDNNIAFGNVNINATGSNATLNLRSVAVTVSGSNTISLNSTNTNVTGSLKLANVMNLRGQDPLPAGTIGDLAVSSSNKLYFYNGAWTLIV